jgi:two-component system NtrC family sensor kinase
VHSNIGALEIYLKDLFLILDAYASTENKLTADAVAHAELERLKAELNLDFLRTDIPLLMAESKEGISRVRKIVQDLKDFSRVDSSQEWQWVDLHQGLNSTLNVVNNEIKYKAEVVKEYGILPEVECLPSEINQVFLNLLVNAAHAIADAERGIITLRSGCDNLHVWIEVADTGSGITPENLKRIFDPFFTTKPIGKGTGLGLSLSYGIVTKHGGSIEVDSKVGTGTTFRVILPQRQSHESTQEEAQ